MPDETVDNNISVNTFTADIDTVNGNRNADSLVIYTPMRGERTQTNEYGAEAVVINGRVVQIGGNNNIIPENGFVISGHGKFTDWIYNYLYPGIHIETDLVQYKLHVTEDKQGFLYYALITYDMLKDTLEKHRASNTAADDAEKLLDAIMSDIDKLRSENTAGRVRSLHTKIYHDALQCERLVSPSYENEIRAIWHIITDQTKEDVRRTMQRYQEAGFNMILIETFAHGYVIYPDSAFTKQLPRTILDFDVLQEYIDLGKEMGIEIHAWFANYMVGEPGFLFDCNVSGSPIIDRFPEWAGTRKDGVRHAGVHEAGFIWLNQTDPDVSAFLLGLYTELLDRYDIDGINLDYIRTSAASHLPHLSMGFEPGTVERFKADTGIDIWQVSDGNSDEWRQFTAWRAAHITEFVRSVKTLTEEKSIEKDRLIRLSAATAFPTHYAYNEKSCDWPAWVRNGYLDFLTPMIYSANDTDMYYDTKYMTTNYPHIPIAAGMSLYRDNDWRLQQLTRQITAARNAGAQGSAHFSSFNLNRRNINVLAEGVFRSKATPYSTGNPF
jgi:uncharacterized lipoprotein YddW (UPF0748 family)